MNKFKYIIFLMGFTLFTSMVDGQTNDTIPVKSKLFSMASIKRINFSKVQFPKILAFKKDTSQIKATAKSVDASWDAPSKKITFFKRKDTASQKPAVLKVKDTASQKPAVLKVKDTASKKLSFFRRKDTASQKLAILKVKDTVSIYKRLTKKILDYTDNTTVSLITGANFSRQIVDAKNYNSNFNYAFTDVNQDMYKTGYFGGIRLDGLIKKKHEYALSFNLSKINTGANYKSSTNLTPVVGSFSTFKAEDHFYVLNLAGHYKKLIPYGNLEKFKFYLVAGPSLDIRLSNASLDNQVSNAYKRIFLKGDLGLEFNNRSLYTLFFHYQHNLGSITKLPIKTNFNSFQLGIMVKATDLL